MTWEQVPEPRKVFLLFLIRKLAEANEYLYKTNFYMSIPTLIGLIDSLSEADKKQLAKQRSRLAEIDANVKTLQNKEELRSLYSEVANYLHEHYLQELKYGVPTRIGSLEKIAEAIKK